MHLAEGHVAVRLARSAIKTFLSEGKKLAPPLHLPLVFDEFRGVFVTLNSGTLRGCIGYPYPNMKLKHTLIDSAISAAVCDYRFPPVNTAELDYITIEVTILTRPERICNVAEIIVGKHGIIVKKDFSQGLLLPQVATEHGWTPQEFLNHAYIKAGLSAATLDAEIYVFEGQIFEEVEPHGDVIEKCIC